MKMSLNAMKVPLIAITPEDDNDNDNDLLSLVDVLTDTENLDADTSPKEKRYRKSNLKIKLNDDITTDLEDFEASDYEDELKIINHNRPVSIESLDLDPGTFEETYKIKVKHSKGKRKLRTQTSTSAKNDTCLKLINNIKDDGRITDIEDVETSDVDIEYNFPEIELFPESFADSVNIEENLRQDSVVNYSPANTPMYVSDEEKLSKKLNLLTVLPLSSRTNILTDTEMVYSDSEMENTSKQRKLRKKRSRGRKQAVTDVEDMDFSEKDAKLYQKVKVGELEFQDLPKKLSDIIFKSGHLVRKLRSSDSDDEETQLKNYVGKVKQHKLQIPRIENEEMTDIDEYNDIDSHVESEFEYDQTVINTKLDEISACCSLTREENTMKKRKNQFNSKSFESVDTDVEESESEVNVIESIDCANNDYGVKFIKSSVRLEVSNSFAENLAKPQSGEQIFTDVENLYSSDEEKKKLPKMQLAVIQTNHTQNETDDECFTDSITDDEPNYPDILLPPPFRKIILFQEKQKGEPIVTIFPFNEVERELCQKECYLTDLESLSGDEDVLDLVPVYHAPTPDLPILDGGSVNAKDNLKVNLYTHEQLTDTEELVLTPRKYRNIKRPTSKLSKLNIKYEENCTKTDTEDINFSDQDIPKQLVRDKLTLPLLDTCDATDVENMVMSDDCGLDENVDFVRALSSTPIHMRELGGETILTTEQDNPFTNKDHHLISNRLLKMRISAPSPMLTDTEDMTASADEDLNLLPRADPATPTEFIKELDSMCSSRIQLGNFKRIDIDAPDEIMFLKCGGVCETYTDVEEVAASDDEVKKIKVSLNWKDFSVTFGSQQKEWDASTQKEGATLSKQTLDEDAAQQDHQKPEDMGVLTYESVLLMNLSHNNLPFPSIPEFVHKTTSYSQIDAMLERMLYEVEEQEKLFTSDLDINDQIKEPCINSLELLPSTDALIEIPIKKSIHVPKTYESVQEIKIEQTDKNNKIYEPKHNVANCTQKLQFNNELLVNKHQNHLDTVQKNLKTLFSEVNTGEAVALLDKTTVNENLDIGTYDDFINFKKDKASFNEMSDTYSDNYYEPIDTQHPCEFTNNNFSNIWYEGTYRNLSIVPEEDEENISLLSSYCSSNKNCHTMQCDFQSKNLFHADVSRENTLNCGLNDTTSSDESDYSTDEDVVKAEVKLLVKTNDKGKEAIEICSVREFVEKPNKNKFSKTDKSQTLPSKLGDKISGFTSKFSSILNNGKKHSKSYTFLDDNQKTNVKSKHEKPVFTLQRLFVRTPENENASKKFSNKSQVELIATPTDDFPLKLSSHCNDQVCIDLYANTPFYPCYNNTNTNPFIEFTSSPYINTNNIPEGYCDWLSVEDQKQGISTSSRKYLDRNEDILLDSQKSLDTSKTFASIEYCIDPQKSLDIIKHFIQSESIAEPYDAQTAKFFEKTTHHITNCVIASESLEVNKVDEKKNKKGFFGTLKNIMGKSSDLSDSDSEKLPKKGQKEKKKKHKAKTQDKISTHVTDKPPIKPKLPTPPDWSDIPPVENNLTLLEKQDSGTLNYDSRDGEHENVNDQASKETDKSTDKRMEINTSGFKQKTNKIIVVEEVTKVFQPAVIEEAQFSITIDPTKKEADKKNRETFTINIDDSIDKIEKEILEKSPILSEEHIIKPVIDFHEPPVRPPRTKDNIYEDIEEPVISHPPDHLKQLPEYVNSDDDDDDNVNRMSVELSKKECEDLPEKVTDSQKMKRKHIGLFGFLSKKNSKDVESDDESNKLEIIEKQDKEILKDESKNMKKESDKVVDDHRKSSLFSIFSKKEKPKDESKAELLHSMSKDKTSDLKTDLISDDYKVFEKISNKSKEHKLFEDDVDESITDRSAECESKKVKEKEIIGFANMSAKVLKDIEDTSNFLSNELSSYEDGMLSNIITNKFNFEKIEDKETINTKQTNIEMNVKESDEPFLEKNKKREILESSNDSDKKTSFLNMFGKRTKKSAEREIVDAPNCNVDESHTDKQTKSTTEIDDTAKKEGFFGFFSKKQKKDIVSKSDNVRMLEKAENCEQATIKPFTEKEKKLNDDSTEITTEIKSELEESVLLSADVKNAMKITKQFLDLEISHYEGDNLKINEVKVDNNINEDVVNKIEECKPSENTRKQNKSGTENEDIAKKEGFFGFFSKKQKKDSIPNSDTVTDQSENVHSLEKTESRKFEQAATKQSIEKDEKIDDDSIEILTKITSELVEGALLSDDVNKSMEITKQFLDLEISHYESVDVKRNEFNGDEKIIEDVVIIKEEGRASENTRKENKSSTEKNEDTAKKEGFFGFFSKKQKKDSIPKTDTVTNQSENVHLLVKTESSHLQDDNNEISTTKATDSIKDQLLPDDVKRSMEVTKQFLDLEISHYESVDVKRNEFNGDEKIIEDVVIIKEEGRASENTRKENKSSTEKNEDTAKKEGFFGFFSKKQKKDSIPKTDTVTNQSENVDLLVKTESSHLQDDNNEISTTKATDSIKDQLLPDDVKRSMEVTKQFLDLEISQYENVLTQRSCLKQTGKKYENVITKKEDKPSEKIERRKSGSPFKFFLKKTKSDEADSVSKLDMSNDKLQISDKTSTIEKEATGHEEVSDNKKINTKDVNEEQKKSSSFLGLFNRSILKGLEDPKTKKCESLELEINETSAIEESGSTSVAEPSHITEPVNCDIRITDEFLNKEITNYDSNNTSKSDEETDDSVVLKSSGLFNIFNKKNKKSSPKSQKKNVKRSNQKSKSIEKKNEDTGLVDSMNSNISSHHTDWKNKTLSLDEAIHTVKKSIVCEGSEEDDNKPQIVKLTDDDTVNKKSSGIISKFGYRVNAEGEEAKQQIVEVPKITSDEGLIKASTILSIEEIAEKSDMTMGKVSNNTECIVENVRSMSDEVRQEVEDVSLEIHKIKKELAKELKEVEFLNENILQKDVQDLGASIMKQLTYVEKETKASADLVIKETEELLKIANSESEKEIVKEGNKKSETKTKLATGNSDEFVNLLDIKHKNVSLEESKSKSANTNDSNQTLHKGKEDIKEVQIENESSAKPIGTLKDFKLTDNVVVDSTLNTFMFVNDSVLSATENADDVKDKVTQKSFDVSNIHQTTSEQLCNKIELTNEQSYDIGIKNNMDNTNVRNYVANEYEENQFPIPDVCDATASNFKKSTFDNVLKGNSSDDIAMIGGKAENKEQYDIDIVDDMKGLIIGETISCFKNIDDKVEKNQNKTLDMKSEIIDISGDKLKEIEKDMESSFLTTMTSENKTGNEIEEMSNKIGDKDKFTKICKNGESLIGNKLKSSDEDIEIALQKSIQSTTSLIETFEGKVKETDNYINQATKNVKTHFDDTLQSACKKTQDTEGYVSKKIGNTSNLAENKLEVAESVKNTSANLLNTLSDVPKAKSIDVAEICSEEAVIKRSCDTPGKVTKDFISSDGNFGTMTRAVSDHMGATEHLKDEWENAFKISETNIDLSTLPPMEDYVPMKSKVSLTKSDSASYVTSPTMQRRSKSQKLSQTERPELLDVSHMPADSSSDEECYIVTEPMDVDQLKKKPLFHLESEEDDSELNAEKKEVDKADGLKTNDERFENMLSSFEKNAVESVLDKVIESRDLGLNEIEKKLHDLDEALDNLEKIDLESSKNDDKKLRRVERKFERMASEVLEKNDFESKQQKLSTPEIEECRENEYQRILSQLSTEEVSDCQKDYSSLWDEHTFSPSDEWDSKTPDSQVDAQELPQGDVVYMGPVTLNKDNLVNKAGIEVDVIPVMRSPCTSPLPHKKKNNIRAKSEMGFHRQDIHEKDRGSLPDLQRSAALKGSILDMVMHMEADTFLSKSYDGGSTGSLIGSDHQLARSLGSSESLSRGAIMNAVVNWLQKSSPFSSTDNVSYRSRSISLFNEDDPGEFSGLRSKHSDSRIPDIFILEDEAVITLPERKSHIRREPCTVEQSPLENSCDQLTELTPKPKPRTTKSPDEHHTEYEMQKSPDTSDILDVDSYTERKKFWENFTKDKDAIMSTKKRMSLHEEPVDADKIMLVKKRTSVHEVSLIPPVPKPRYVLQTAQSLTKDVDIKTENLKERAISIESTGSVTTDTTNISGSNVISSDIPTKPISEYQASYQPPSHVVESTRLSNTELRGELDKTDSLDSELEFSTQNQSCENTGYISDSGDVEHYISDSEIEDRVPQIRERQMSVAEPFVSTRKTIYERSASLPTEDLYEVSARSAKLRKQYYEQQIKKEMIAEHLMTECEEEPFPECKTLDNLQVKEEEPSGMRSAPEKIGTNEKEDSIATVRDLARSFGETIVTKKDLKTLKESPEKDSTTASIKNLTRTFESESVETEYECVKDADETFYESQDKSNVSPTETSGSSVKDLAKTFEKGQTSIYNQNLDQIFQKVSKQYTPKYESASSGKHSSTESDQSFSEADMSQQLAKENSISKPSDSMEVHVDKSEIEDSEKVTDFDQDATDLETKSIDSLNATETSPKTAITTEDIIPEITVTLSGKQRRISEESDEVFVNKEDVNPTSLVSDIVESPIHQPVEHVQDIVWEVSVESQQFDEHATDILTELETKKISMKSDHRAIENNKFSKKKIKQEILSPDDGIEIEKTSPSHELSDDNSHAYVTDKLTPSDELLRPKSSDVLYEIEKDDEFSGSVRDESDLGSEIHQDHSDSYASDKIKSESHSDIEKIILESLHQQHVDPEEAKKIASALIEDIEIEIQRRNETVTDLNELSTSNSECKKGQVSDYLRQLAETKGLDEREVELVESVLARRQRELAKLARGDTQASSMEITDEDLKFSGTEIDYSNILEQQIDQLEAEKCKTTFDKIEDEINKSFKDKTSVFNVINEEHKQEESVSHDFKSVTGEYMKANKTDMHTKSSDSVKGEKVILDKKDTILEENETILETETIETKALGSKDEVSIQEYEEDASDTLKEIKQSFAFSSDAKEYTEDTKIKSIDKFNDTKSCKEESLVQTSHDKTNILGKFDCESFLTEKTPTGVEEVSERKHAQTESTITTEKEVKSDSIQEKVENLKEGIETLESIKKEHTKICSNLVTVEHVQQESQTISSKVLGEVIESDLDKLIASGKLTLEQEKCDTMKPIVEKSEILVVKHEEIKRTFSDESKSSQEESGKSPEEQFSTCSSGRKGDSDTFNKVSEKHDVILRKTKTAKDCDTSSSSSNLKHERKSGMDFEAYSSSGESHYHSFELDSGKSRPCSSDVEGLIAAGSSEYESALTSQDVSAPSHFTSAEYHTAVSSLGSKESMKSLDSESSGNLASVEVSEASETLVPSTFETDGDVDLIEEQKCDSITKQSKSQLHNRQSTELSDSEILEIDDSLNVSEDDEIKPTIDTQTKMKRSYEMTFQPEPKVFVTESPQSESAHEMEERFGTSLDDGSVLSMSLSSTSSAAALRTVIELSRGDSDRYEGVMTVSRTSDQISLDDMDNFQRESKESLIMHSSSDVSTSTHAQGAEQKTGSITMITSSIIENGTPSVCTQVSSHSYSSEQSSKENIEESVEPKKKGHKRYDSTSFSPSLISSARAEVERISALAESDKYTTELSIKEVSSDEKKDVDESYETEADQGFQRDLREGRFLDQDSKIELQTQKKIVSSQSPASTSDLEHTCTIDDTKSDFVRAHVSSEHKTKDEFQTSAEEPEQDMSSTPTRPQEIQGVKKPTTSDKQVLEKHDSYGKLSGTSSEKSSFESEAEAEAAFNMVAHVSPAHKVKQICPILEDEDAEKHELETRERAQKEYEKRRAQVFDQSPGSVPDIKITQHMTPLVDREFHYPDLELEEKEEAQKSTPETPASNSSKSSEETDQGREYVLEDTEVSIPEETMTESKSEVGTVVEKTLQETETESPNSDSFEMVEKPDPLDDFVVIEEVAKEAQENDAEGKSVKMPSTKYVKKHDEEVEELLVKSAPATTTVMTDLKYYPDGSSSDELGFEFEDSPPQLNKKDEVEQNKNKINYVYEYDRELEANKKWIEQQFQGDQAAMAAAGYGYEMEFERGPLEDIKEEDVNDFDPTSSRIGSLGSQKESGGSLGSVKDSFSSTPEYDVLAGRKYFTRSGEHDDVSMSSLQEFENLERAMSLENRRCHQGSQDSSSNGSLSKRYVSRSGQGDDVSVNSLKEFEGLEKACIAVHKTEVKAKEEEAMLAQIDEGQESIASESESCETISGTDKKLIPDSDEEDYEKRMFEIDEIIRQAQTNVERFIDIKDGDKTESIGRGDSFEEVSKVPDLDLDAPIIKPITKIQWTGTDDVMATSTDSLDFNQDKPSHHDSTDSLDQKTTAGDIMTASTDSIEFQIQKSKDIMTDSIEVKNERSYMISSDSLELATGATNVAVSSDSIDEDGSRIGCHDHSTSSTGKDFSSSAKEDILEHIDFKDQRAEYMLGSTDSLDPSSSTATHATYQYETDSVYSGSFTSGGSNTMVSSTDTIDPNTAHAVDLSAAVRKVWFDDDCKEASLKFTTEYFDDSSKPYVTEVIEPCKDDEYSHTIHRRVELPPEVRKITFHGIDADQQMQQFIENFGEGEDIQEVREVDDAGNVHLKRVVQKRLIIKTDDPKQPSQGLSKNIYTDSQGTKTIYTQQFEFAHQDPASAVHSLLTSIAGDVTAEESVSAAAVEQPASLAPGSIRAQATRKRQLRYDISLDDQTEVDPREHDWRFYLPKHAETEESSSQEASGPIFIQERHVADQHELSEEMKELLKHMDEESKK